MKIDHGPSWPPLDRSAEPDRIPTPLITAIRRDQIPEDLRSAFLSGDILLFCSPSRHTSSTVNPRPTRIREGVSLPTRKCPWCATDEVFLGLIVSVIVSACLVAASFQNEEALAHRVFRYVIAALAARLMFLVLVLVHTHYYGPNIHDSANLRCARGVKFHCFHNLASRMLSPSSLLLLQQPILNARSFFRFYKFFTSGRTRGPADADADSCIRAHVAAGLLPHAGLIDDGSHVLLGLAPCQDVLVGFGWGSSHLRVLYRSYRDWKRWRLAAVLCERLRGRDGMYLPRGDSDDRSLVNPLDRLGRNCARKWLLVDPEIFS